MAHKARMTKLKEMTTPELAGEAARLMKVVKKQIVELERTVNQLAYDLGADLNLVKERE